MGLSELVRKVFDLPGSAARGAPDNPVYSRRGADRIRTMPRGNLAFLPYALIFALAAGCASPSESGSSYPSAAFRWMPGRNARPGSLAGPALTVVADQIIDPDLGRSLVTALRAHGIPTKEWNGGRLAYPAVTYQLELIRPAGHPLMRWSVVIYDGRGDALASAESCCPDCVNTAQFEAATEQLALELARLR